MFALKYSCNRKHLLLVRKKKLFVSTRWRASLEDMSCYSWLFFHVNRFIPINKCQTSDNKGRDEKSQITEGQGATASRFGFQQQKYQAYVADQFQSALPIKRCKDAQWEFKQGEENHESYILVHSDVFGKFVSSWIETLNSQEAGCFWTVGTSDILLTFWIPLFKKVPARIK